MTTPFYSWTTIGEFSTAIVLILGACGGLLSIIFKGTGNSRCEDISICCGVLSCKRKPKTPEEVELQDEDKGAGVGEIAEAEAPPAIQEIKRP